MPSFTCDIEFEVFCETCGKGLCNTVRTEDAGRHGTARVHIPPCETCMEQQWEDAFEEGRAEGHKEAEKEHEQ